jgi:chaperonin GroES
MGARLLVQRREAQKQSSGGLYLPEEQTHKINEGEVLEVGEGVKHISKGDLVMFEQYSCTPVRVSGTEYVLVLEDDIYAILEPTA